MAPLTRSEPTIASAWSCDPKHHASELQAVWYRDWVCVGRLADSQEHDLSLERPSFLRCSACCGVIAGVPTWNGTVFHGQYGPFSASRQNTNK